jgi:hypothetical protein
MKTFSNPYAMADFINNLNVSELEKERLMFKGVEHQRVNGTFSIEVPKETFKLNGDIANDFNDMQEADFWDGDDSWCE